MNIFQIHVINGAAVHLLDFSERKKKNGSLQIENGSVRLILGNNRVLTVRGVHKNHNDLAPVSMTGLPFVYADEERNLLCPMEERLEKITDIDSLSVGDYLITED